MNDGPADAADRGGTPSRLSATDLTAGNADVATVLSRAAQALHAAALSRTPRSHVPVPELAAARLDALILLEYATGRTREALLAEYRTTFTDLFPMEERERFVGLLQRRADGPSIAYLVGRREFFGRDFAVGPGVLVPRPESEHVVETVLELLDRDDSGVESTSGPMRLHDCCTGSGCIGITIACELSAAGVPTRLVLSDRSTEALMWARKNAETHLGTAWREICSIERRDLLGVLEEGVEHDAPHIITANPPYLTSTETEAALSHGWGEPASALDGGADGLGPYRRLALQAFSHLVARGYVVVEHGFDQGSAVRDMLQNAGFEAVDTRTDLAGRDRVTTGRKPTTKPA